MLLDGRVMIRRGEQKDKMETTAKNDERTMMIEHGKI